MRLTIVAIKQYVWRMSSVRWLKAHEIVAAYKRRTGDTDAAIARRCGVSTATISRIFAGIRTPDFTVARRLRDGIGVPFDAWCEPASKSFQHAERAQLRQRAGVQATGPEGKGLARDHAAKAVGSVTGGPR